MPKKLAKIKRRKSTRNIQKPAEIQHDNVVDKKELEALRNQIEMQQADRNILLGIVEKSLEPVEIEEEIEEIEEIVEDEISEIESEIAEIESVKINEPVLADKEVNTKIVVPVASVEKNDTIRSKTKSLQLSKKTFPLVTKRKNQSTPRKQSPLPKVSNQKASRSPVDLQVRMKEMAKETKKRRELKIKRKKELFAS